MTTAWVASAPQFNLKAFIDEVPTAAIYPSSKNTKAWTTLQTDVLTKVFTGQTMSRRGDPSAIATAVVQIPVVPRFTG